MAIAATRSSTPSRSCRSPDPSCHWRSNRSGFLTAYRADHPFAARGGSQRALPQGVRHVECQWVHKAHRDAIRHRLAFNAQRTPNGWRRVKTVRFGSDAAGFAHLGLGDRNAANAAAEAALAAAEPDRLIFSFAITRSGELLDCAPASPNGSRRPPRRHRRRAARRAGAERRGRAFVANE